MATDPFTPPSSAKSPALPSSAPETRPRSKHGKGSAKARRSAARLAAVQALYEIDLAGTRTEAVISEFLSERLGEDEDKGLYVAPDPTLFTNIVRGVSARHAEIDGMVDGALAGRGPVGRLEMLLGHILRCGAYELAAHDDTHAGIIINDYLDVTHAFFAGREPSIINGVLDRLARTLRSPEELTEKPQESAVEDSAEEGPEGQK